MSREIKGTITTEQPQEHWGFLNVQGKTVLDLGCGINSEHTPTPWYFLQDMKANHVVGIDSNPQSYEWFIKNFKVKNFLPIMDYVDRIEKFELYLGYYKPEVVKMDIEGLEYEMIRSITDWSKIKLFIVEYHFHYSWLLENRTQKFNEVMSIMENNFDRIFVNRNAGTSKHFITHFAGFKNV